MPSSALKKRSGDAAPEGSRGAAFDSATLTGAVLPPHAESCTTTEKDVEGVPDQSEWSESYELVSPLSISAINGGGGNDHLDARDWWTDFAGLDPQFSASQTDPQCTHELERG